MFSTKRGPLLKKKCQAPATERPIISWSLCLFILNNTQICTNLKFFVMLHIICGEDDNFVFQVIYNCFDNCIWVIIKVKTQKWKTEKPKGHKPGFKMICTSIWKLHFENRSQDDKPTRNEKWKLNISTQKPKMALFKPTF